jgi:tetratricopeptide (TPR) repeat protein
MSDMPESIQRLYDVLDGLPGLAEVEISIEPLDEIRVEDLGIPEEYADLPQVALQRTGGGRRDEVMVTCIIWPMRDREGWVAIEFLSWWVRDLARSGEMVQIRSVAMPPVDEGTQLGTTLQFVIEFFFISTDKDHSNVYEAMSKHAESLQQAIEEYADAIENPADPDDDPTAMDLESLTEAAEEGDAESQFVLAQRYHEGEGVAADPEAAFRWYSESADQGFPPAIMFVGYCYANAVGVDEDYTKAAEHFREAADAGFPFAMGLLAQCYATGQGVAEDMDEAMKLYRQAAELGEPICQAQLGEAYEFGIGVEQDLAQALHWYTAAYDQGLEDVEEAMDRVKEQM